MFLFYYIKRVSQFSQSFQHHISCIKPSTPNHHYWLRLLEFSRTYNLTKECGIFMDVKCDVEFKILSVRHIQMAYGFAKIEYLKLNHCRKIHGLWAHHCYDPQEPNDSKEQLLSSLSLIKLQPVLEVYQVIHWKWLLKCPEVSIQTTFFVLTPSLELVLPIQCQSA